MQLDTYYWVEADVVVWIHLGGNFRFGAPMIITSNERMFGYARVSPTDQELNLQVDSLLAHGVPKDRLFCDKISGTHED